MRIRTGYSFKVACGHLPEVVSRVREIGWDCLPVSDRMSTFAFEKMTKLAKEAGLRPIYGVELAVVADLGNKRPSPDYWTFFATESLRPLHDLIGEATSAPGKEPCLLYSQALSAETSSLVKIAGERVVLDEVIKNKKNLGRFFVGLSPSLPMGLYRETVARRLSFLATSDNIYTRREDLEFYRVAMGFRANTQSYPQHIMSDKEWKESVRWFAEPHEIEGALRSRRKMMDLCQASLVKAEMVVPDKPRTLRQMCVIGAKKLGVDLKDDVYAKRMDRELAMIEEKDFSNYFYVLADMIGWAKERMVVGPARGCFLPDQKVILSGGVYKDIQKVKAGDVVKDVFGKYKTVLGKFEYEIDEEVIEIEFDDGEKLTCTEDHEIRVGDSWVKAKDLGIGQITNSQVKSWSIRDDAVRKMRLTKLVKRFGWPAGLASKVVDGEPLTIAEAKKVPSRSKYQVKIRCLVCNKNKLVQVRRLANRIHGLAWKPICSDCVNAEATRTEGAIKSNSLAQIKIQGGLAQRIKNSLSVSKSRNRRHSLHHDLLFGFPGYRREIKKRDGFICQHPSCDHVHRKKDTHHIVDPKNSHPHNIITLCTGCHTRHHNFRRYQPKRAAKEQRIFLRIARKNTDAQGQESQIKKIISLLRPGL